MADKVSLEKHHTAAELQEINRKLDFLMNEVSEIRRDLKDLQTENADDLYQLNSKFYKFCNELQGQFFEFQSKIYSGSKDVSKQLQDLQAQNAYSRFMSKSFSISSALLFGGLAWLLSLIIILD